jgi:hypothetical protein|tara:strand:- start:268 stop:474 length:207 start_codon:yes stop_codon:yes gene_type:complete
MRQVIVTQDRKEEFDALKERARHLQSELKRLSEMRDAGQITSDEWSTQSQEVLHESFSIYEKIVEFNS